MRGCRGPSWGTLLLHVSLALILLLLTAPRARADCKGSVDPLCELKELISKIESVAPDQSSVVSAGKTLKNDAAKVESRLKDVSSDVASFEDDADAVLKMFQTALETIDSDALQLSSELLRRMDDGRQLVDHMLAGERNALQDFAGPPGQYHVTADSGCSATCENFRNQLVGMFRNYETSFNLSYDFFVAQLKLNGAPLPSADLPPLDLSFLIDILQRAPGFVLFPLHEGLTAVGASGQPNAACPTGDAACLSLASLNEIFEHLNRSLQEMVQAVDAGVSARALSTSATSSAVSSECLIMFQDDTREKVFVNAAWISRLAGSIISSIGEGMIALGLSELDPKGGVSVALSVVVGNPRSFLQTAGTLIQGLGQGVKMGGERLNRMIIDCRGDLNLELMFCLLATDGPTADTLQSCKTDILAGKTFGLEPGS